MRPVLLDDVTDVADPVTGWADGPPKRRRRRCHMTRGTR